MAPFRFWWQYAFRYAILPGSIGSKQNRNKLTVKHNLLIDRVHILEDRSLKLDDVSTVDEGEYSCEADNAVGSVSAVGTLTVYCAYYELKRLFI